MDVYSQIATKIIAQQETIIGPVAIEQAQSVSGLKVHWDDHKAEVTGNGEAVVDRLVRQYKELFGKISVEVCKEATAGLLAKLPADRRPKSLTG